jgi:Mce-associated membrane protein
MSVTHDVEELADRAEAEAVAAEKVAAAARARARELRGATGTDQETESEPEPESEPDAAAAGRHRWRRPRLAAVAAGIAIFATCALVAASGYLLLHHQRVGEEQQRHAEFAAAARQAVVTLMSIDGAKAQEDVQRIIDSSTGQFRDDFQNSSKEFVDVAKESKSVTTASVKASAVESMSEDSAVVLVTAATTIRNTAGANQQPRTWRLSVDVVRDGGQIKMSKVDFVP